MNKTVFIILTILLLPLEIPMFLLYWAWKNVTDFYEYIWLGEDL